MDLLRYHLRKNRLFQALYSWLVSIMNLISYFARRIKPNMTMVSRQLKRKQHAAIMTGLAEQSGKSRLSGKVAIVTGAASGIGRTTALLFAREGAKVIIADINESDGIDVERQIINKGGEATFICTDVTKESDVQIMIRTTIDKYGKLDILVNNAGILLEGSVASTSPGDWQRVVDINLSSVYLCCRFAIPEMIKNGGGAVVNTSSIQGLKGFHNSAGYAASKGGILALTRQTAREYAGLGIRINSISPGIIYTPIFGKAVKKPADREGLFESWANQMPVGYFGLPEDIAFATIYLASDESSYVTGVNLVVDGGLTIRGI